MYSGYSFVKICEWLNLQCKVNKIYYFDTSCVYLEYFFLFFLEYAGQLLIIVKKKKKIERLVYLHQRSRV